MLLIQEHMMTKQNRYLNEQECFTENEHRQI